MTDFRIRPAAPYPDSAALSAIYSRYVQQSWVSFEVESPTAEDMAIRMQVVMEQGLPYLVAEDAKGIVLGYAYALPYRPRTAYQFSVEHSIYLAPEAQGKGVAKALMDAVVAHCKALKKKTMIAIVGLNPDIPTEHNQSVRFHQKYGFKFVGVLDNIGQKFGRWTGTAVLLLDLQEPKKEGP
jgi:L-amino acid N-acyltransferase YncA